MNVNGLSGKLKKNAFLLTAGLTSYSRASEYNSNDPIGTTLELITKPDGALYQLQETFKSTGNIKYKLWDAPHASQGIFKIATYVRIAAELGFLTKYKKLSEEIMKGAALTSIIMPASGPIQDKFTPNGQSRGRIPRYNY